MQGDRARKVNEHSDFTLQAARSSLRLLWLGVPTITSHAGCLGACGGFQHLVAVHQVAVILVSCLCIHNRDVRNDGNWEGRRKDTVRICTPLQGDSFLLFELLN